MDGEVRLYKRKRSSIWQVIFMMDGRQVRVSTKKRILKDAKDAAREIYLDYRFRQKNGLPRQCPLKTTVFKSRIFCA